MMCGGEWTTKDIVGKSMFMDLAISKKSINQPDLNAASACVGY